MKNKKYQKAWSSGKMSDFLPYLYKKLREENPELPNLMPNRVLDWYNSDSNFKSYADEQLAKRISIYSKHQSKAASISGANNLKSGHWDKVKESLIEWRKNNPEKTIEIAKHARSFSPIGQINKERGWMQQIANFETRSRGGKTSGMKNLESGSWDKTVKLGTKKSVEAKKKRKYAVRKRVFDLLPDEFTSKQLKEVLKTIEPHNIEFMAPYKEAQYKSYLNDKEHCIKIHQGSGNQFDPPIYKKIV